MASEAARISFRVPPTRDFSRLPQMTRLLAGYFSKVYSAVHCTLQFMGETKSDLLLWKLLRRNYTAAFFFLFLNFGIWQHNKEALRAARGAARWRSPVAKEMW